MSTPLDLAARRGRPSLRPITTGPRNQVVHIHRSSSTESRTDGCAQTRPATWRNDSPPGELTHEQEHRFLIREPTDAEVDDYRRKFQGYLERSWKGDVPFPPREVPEERVRLYAGIREFQDGQKYHRAAAVCDGDCDATADTAWDGMAQQHASRRGPLNAEEESRAAHGVPCTCCPTSSSRVPCVLKRNMHSAANVPPEVCLVELPCDKNAGSAPAPIETVIAARPAYETNTMCHHFPVPDTLDIGVDKIWLNTDFDIYYRESIQEPLSWQSRASFPLRPSFGYPPAPASQVPAREALSCLRPIPIEIAENQESPCHPCVDLEWQCCNTLISPPHFPYEFVMTMPNAQRDADAESLPSWPATASQRSLSSVADSESEMSSGGVPPSKSQCISYALNEGLSEVNYGGYENVDLIASLEHCVRIRSRVDRTADASFISDACHTLCAADRPGFPSMKRKRDSPRCDEPILKLRKRSQRARLT